MAKLKGPLFSLDARGSVGPALTYSSRRSGSQVRFQKKQQDVITAARTTQRDYFEEGYAAWNTLSSEEQQQWNDFID